MQPLTVDEAFAHFRARAAAYGSTDVSEEAHPEAFGHRLLTIRRGLATVRLIRDGKERHLTLEGMHGPPGGPTWWLDSFDAACPDELCRRRSRNR